MALEAAQDPVARATRVARAQTQPAWADVSSSIMSEVRSIVSHAEPLVVFTAGASTAQDAEQSRDLVSTRVVVAALRRRLQGGASTPQRIDLVTDHERLVGVEVDLVCTYGHDLHVLGGLAVTAVHEELVALIGHDPLFGSERIAIRVVDVVEGDATLT